MFVLDGCLNDHAAAPFMERDRLRHELAGIRIAQQIRTELDRQWELPRIPCPIRHERIYAAGGCCFIGQAEDDAGVKHPGQLRQVRPKDQLSHRSFTAHVKKPRAPGSDVRSLRALV